MALPIWGFALLALGISLVTVPAAMRAAGWCGALDRPGHLKPHQRPTPLLGGLGILTAALLATTIALASAQQRHAGATAPCILLMGLAVGLWILGFLDDRRNLGAARRLVVELILSTGFAVYLVLASGAPLWFVPVGALWLAGVTNAVNMLDGLDGLAGSLGLIAGAGMAWAAGLAGLTSPALLAGCLAGACLGFLAYNRPPARVFMGDNGSLPLGFMLAGLALIGAVYAPGPGRSVTLGLGMALMVGAPVSDMLLAIIRRLRLGKPPFQGDRSHTYDQLRDRWRLSARAVLVVIAVCHLVFAAIGVLVSRLSVPQAIALTLTAMMLTAGVLVAGRFLGLEGPSKDQSVT